jgi:phospholipid/cholesterol/gamma-HCH transport system permease protein
MFLQMDAIGVGSLNIVILTGLFTGMVLALQTALSLETFGAKNYVGRVVALSMIRELGPVLTALMVAGRVGSGIAAELGSMIVTDQINAMRAMGSDPLRKLVVPRLLAAIITVPLLTILSDTVGLIGGWLISTLVLKISGGLYFQSSIDALTFEDILGGLIKPVVFGYIIAMVGCYMGLQTTGGTQGVGRSTTQSVVICSVLVLASDFIMTKIFFAVF